jgi:mannose-6-phosphate isomerase-like protein (cupin superfamily)
MTRHQPHMIKHIKNNGRLLGIIVPGSFNETGVHFFTDQSLSQQLAYMRHPAGHDIQAHVHKPVRREIHYTQEVLILRKGRLRVDFYDDDQNYLESHVLESGDIILLVEGGHGFKALEEIEMFEIKQGPFVPSEDKVKFHGIQDAEAHIPGV